MNHLYSWLVCSCCPQCAKHKLIVVKKNKKEVEERKEKSEKKKKGEPEKKKKKEEPEKNEKKKEEKKGMSWTNYICDLYTTKSSIV